MMDHTVEDNCNNLTGDDGFVTTTHENVPATANELASLGYSLSGSSSNSHTNDPMLALFNKLEIMMKEQFEQARRHVEQKLKDELTAQAKLQADKLSDQVRLQTEQLKNEVSEQVTTRMREDFQNIRTEISEFKNKFEVHPEMVQVLTEGFTKLRTEQNSLKLNVEQVASRLETLATNSVGKVYEFLEVKNNEISRKLETELRTAIQQTVSSVHVEQNTSVQTLATELNNIKSTLNQELAVWRNDLTSQVNNMQREISALKDLLTASQRVTNRVEEAYSSAIRNDTGPNRVTDGVGAEPTVSSVLLEEGLLHYMLFKKFTPEKNDVHPIEFIKSFRNVWPRSWTEKQKIKFAVGFMRGEALTWATEVAESCRTFEEFEKAFRGKYWSFEIQDRLRKEVLNPEPFNPKQDSLKEYFERYLNKTRFWDEPILSSDVLLILQAKLPMNIRKRLARCSVNNLERFMGAVTDLDFDNFKRSLWRNASGNGNYNDRRNFEHRNHTYSTPSGNYQSNSSEASGAADTCWQDQGHSANLVEADNVVQNGITDPTNSSRPHCVIV